MRYIRAHQGIGLVVAAVEQGRLTIRDLSKWVDFADYVAKTLKKLGAAPAPVHKAESPEAKTAKQEETRSKTDKENKLNAKWTQLDILVAAVGTDGLCARDGSFQRFSETGSRLCARKHANLIENAITSLRPFKGRKILLVDCVDLRDPVFEQRLQGHTGLHPDILNAMSKHELFDAKLTHVAEWISSNVGQMMAVAFVCKAARQRGEALRHLLYKALTELGATTSTCGLLRPHEERTVSCDHFPTAVCSHSSQCIKCHTKSKEDADAEEDIVAWIATGLRLSMPHSNK